MTRPTCWHCSKQLVYWKGKPVFETYTDPLGHEHHLHKNCYKYGGYADKPITAQPDMEYQKAMTYYAKDRAK